jgi:hypothetical protein
MRSCAFRTQLRRPSSLLGRTVTWIAALEVRIGIDDTALEERSLL